VPGCPILPLLMVEARSRRPEHAGAETAASGSASGASRAPAGPGVRLRPYRAGDESEINRAFNAAFGLARPLPEWQWKFADGPEGRWIVVGEDASGAVVTHFAALPVWLQDGGRRVLAGQNVDVFALPSARSGLGAARAYLETARCFFALFEAPERLAVLFGFPGPRNDPLVVGRLGYRPVRPVEVWTRAAVVRWRWHLGHEVVDEDLPHLTDRLWARAAHRYRVAAVRDAAWYRRRFCGRPGVEYRFVTAWRRGEPHAVAVLRVGDGVLWVCDLVWDGEDDRSVRAIDAAAGELARRHGCSRLEAWMSGDAQAAELLAGLGWLRRGHEAGLRMVARGVDPQLTIDRLAASFYFTMADADLV